MIWGDLLAFLIQSIFAILGEMTQTDNPQHFRIDPADIRITCSWDFGSQDFYLEGVPLPFPFPFLFLSYPLLLPCPFLLFPPLLPFPSISPFPSFPPWFMQLRSLGERCKFPQRVQTEPGRQNIFGNLQYKIEHMTTINLTGF